MVQLKKGLMPFSDLYRLVTDEKGLMDHKQLGLLLHDSLQVKLKAIFIFTEIVPNIETKSRLLFGKYRHLVRSKIFSWSTI